MDNRSRSIAFAQPDRFAEVRMLAAEVLKHVRRIGLRLAHLHAGLQTTDERKEVRRNAFGIVREWHPEIGFVTRKLKLSRHDADNLGRVVVQTQRPADDVRIATEASLPECMTDYADLVLTGRVFAFDKRATEQRVDAEHFEKVGGDRRDRQTLGLTGAGEVRGAVVVNRD